MIKLLKEEPKLKGLCYLSNFLKIYLLDFCKKSVMKIFLTLKKLMKLKPYMKKPRKNLKKI